MSLELKKKELLYFLSSHSQASYEVISDRLQLSKRSIKLLTESLLYNYGHIFSIQEKSNRLSLYIYDEEKFRLLITKELLESTDLNSFHKRQALFFQILLDTEEYISADSIAEQLEISRRSLSRDMNRMKEVLETYQLSLRSKAGVGVQLQGSELQKRLLYLYEVMPYVEEGIDLPSEVADTYLDFISSKNFPLDIQRSFLSTLQLTWKRRDKVLDERDFNWFTRQVQLDLPTIFYEILEYYWGRPIHSLEKNFLTFPMQLGLISAEVKRPDVLVIAKEVLALTVEEYGIQLDISESAALLERHLIYMLNRSTMKWEFTEVGLREELLRSSFSQVVSQFFIKQLSNRLSLSVSDKEIPLLAAWMDLLLARNSKPLISKIAVISQAGQSFNFLVETQIHQLFGSDTQIDFLEFTNHEPYEELNQRYDLIFTDNLLYSQELFQSFLSLTLVTKENQAEREKMERMVLARKIQLYCQVKTVYLDEHKSYEENLREMLQQLEKQQVLSSHSIEKMLEKEGKTPALSESGLAFPHLTVKGLEQIVLVVAENEEWTLMSERKQVVSDFILLLIPDELEESHQDLLYQLFDNTFRLENQSHIKERLGIVFMTDLPSLLTD